MPKEKKPIPPDPLTQARLRLAEYDGFIARLTGYLGLDTLPDPCHRFLAVKEWLGVKCDARDIPVEEHPPPSDIEDEDPF